jgi:hypothetical protein
MTGHGFTLFGKSSVTVIRDFKNQITGQKLVMTGHDCF